jgi:uncharacterized MAPEG superfamily protein
MPLFASAIIVSNMAKLPVEGLTGINGFAGTYLLLRIAYNYVYVNATRNKTSYIRTLLFVTSTLLCWRQFALAAYAL